MLLHSKSVCYLSTAEVGKVGFREKQGAGQLSQQLLAYIRMGKKWLCLPQLMAMHVWFLIPSQRQGKVHRYKDFVGKRLKLLHPFPFAGPAKGHLGSPCNARAHLKGGG